jgi:hypothetical protein
MRNIQRPRSHRRTLGRCACRLSTVIWCHSEKTSIASSC